METKEIYQKLHQFVNEVTLGYKGEIDLNLLREAAYRLEELEKQLAEQQTQWISVEERLPGAYGRYISYNGKDIVISYSDPVRPGLWSDEKITHWMPLPEPPQPKVPTFKDMFLEEFPFAAIDEYGYPCVALCEIYGYAKTDTCMQDYGSCWGMCWDQPYFEPKGEGDAE